MDYKISVENKGEVYRDIRIEIPRKEYLKRFDAAAQKASSKVRLNGFRPGKAPKDMVAKLYGTELHHEVMEVLADKALREAIEKHSLNIVGHPHVHFGKDDGEKDLEITANVAVVPSPEIKGYKKLKFEVEVRNPAEDELSRELDGLRERKAEYRKLENRDVAQEGDFATVEYRATVEGKALGKKETETRFVTIGKGMLPEELDKALIGTKVGEARDVQIALSENYADKAMAGKTADYRVEIKELQEKILPELSDEFAKETGMAEDLSGLKTRMQKEIEEAYKEQNLRAKEKKLFETILEKNPFEVPEVMIDEEIRSLLFEMNALDRRNEKSYRIDVAPFRQHLKPQAEYRVKSLLALDRIIEQDKIQPSDEEFEAWLEGLVTKGGFKSREELNKQVGLPESADRLKTICAREKTTEDLIEKSDITEVAPKVPEADSAEV